MEKSKKDNFLLSVKHAKRIRGLSDEDAGKLLKSIFSFAEGEDGEEYELSERADIIFDYIKEEITEASEKYEKTCKARKAAISKRWGKEAEQEEAVKDTSVYNSIQMNTSDTDNDSDSEYDNGHNSLSESMCVDTCTHARKGKEKIEPCGFFQNVYLTEDEKRALEADYGADKLKKAIMLLSARIEKDGKYKNDSHAAVIRLWVMDAVDEEDVRAIEREGRKKKARGSPSDEKLEKAKKAGFDFDFEDVYEKP